MSDRTVYAIASGKGGVGKTTTAINLGAMLADRGHEVVVVDTDLGMANLADFLDFEIGSPTLQEVLAGDARADAAIDRAPGDIDVLPSAPDIEAFTRSDPTNLDGVVADLRGEYDYVLLDTGAGVSYDVLVPMALADGVLLVATPDVASVRDTAKTGDLAARVDTEVVGAVLTQRSSDILTADDVEETLGTDVLAVVPEDEAVPMGIDAGRPLAAFAPNAPAGQAYRDLAGVLTGEADPDPELDLDDESVDVTFDADPPGRTGPGRADAGGSEADGPASADAAGGVRDTAGDESEGLLGGELAKAAEEIRAEAGRASDARSPNDSVSGDLASSGARDGGAARGNPRDAGGDAVETTDADQADNSDADRRDESRADRHDANEADEHDADDAARSDESEARSVDDLIDEHLGDDQDDFGDSADALGDDADDPLAEAGEVPTGEDGDGEDAASDSPDAAAEPGGVPFDGGDREGRARRGVADDADQDAGPDAIDAEDRNSEGNPNSGGSRDPSRGRTSDDDRDDDGVLGRLGSLFR